MTSSVVLQIVHRLRQPSDCGNLIDASLAHRSALTIQTGPGFFARIASFNKIRPELAGQVGARQRISDWLPRDPAVVRGHRGLEAGFLRRCKLARPARGCSSERVRK